MAQGTDARGTASSAEKRAAWVQACRLRTLPLAAAGSVVAAALAADAHAFRWPVFVLMFLTSVALQVIANFADDYGDLASGLDDDSRVGPRRGMQRGIISVPEMRRALAGLVAATLALGVALVIVAFASGPALGGGTVVAAVVFVALGVASIAAAMLYTMGRHPYGYVGLGDPAMRVYETALVVASVALFLLSAALCGVRSPLAYLVILVACVPWARALVAMWRIPDPERFDRLMGPMSGGSVIVAAVFALVVVIAG